MRKNNLQKLQSKKLPHTTPKKAANKETTKNLWKRYCYLIFIGEKLKEEIFKKKSKR
ncbi:hypothetical protein [Sessilibacter corallicola]|uniref:hypothetical protein n=1 Tax=Sessilibacter corallicola TaxID=2904075 RepID=UPI001E2BA2FE|nr:hypothetical protein [Sessilibacter corallicola]MCE2028529.1 hypothetical protein [Sessilibacter corallicola]